MTIRGIWWREKQRQSAGLERRKRGRKRKSEGESRRGESSRDESRDWSQAEKQLAMTMCNWWESGELVEVDDDGRGSWADLECLRGPGRMKLPAHPKSVIEAQLAVTRWTTARPQLSHCHLEKRINGPTPDFLSFWALRIMFTLLK